MRARDRKSNGQQPLSPLESGVGNDFNQPGPSRQANSPTEQSKTEHQTTNLERANSVNLVLPVDDQGNTPLHKAASLGDFKLLCEQLEQLKNKELMNYMATVNWYNKHRETALCLAIEHEHFDIAVSLLSLGELDSQLDSLVSIDSEKFDKLIDHAKNEGKNKIIESLLHTASELKRNRHGGDYQLKWLMLFAWQGHSDWKVKFRLGTEVGEADKFDDLVFRYKGSDEKIKYRYLQAKHEQHLDKNPLKISQFTKKGHKYELKKYFTTYLVNEPSQVDNLVLCTNNYFDFDPKDFRFQEIGKEEREDKYKIFSDLGGKLYKFNFKDENDKNDFIKKLFGSNVSPDVKNTIEKFLSKFVFAVEQPSSIFLSRKIKEKMGSDTYNFIHFAVFKEYIDEWFASRQPDNTARFILSSEIKGFFDGLKYKIANIELSGLAPLYKEKIKKFIERDLKFTTVEGENKNIVVDKNINSIKEFLLEPTNKILKLVYTQKDVFLIIAKVYQALKEQYKDTTQYTVSDLQSLSLLNFDSSSQERVVNAFKSENKHLLVIECSFMDEDGENLIRKLNNEVLARTNVNKKIIFILNEKVSNELNNIPQELPIVAESISMKTKLNRFKVKSQSTLLDTEIVFQGNKVKLKEFLGINNINDLLKQQNNQLYNKLCQAIDEDLLVELINNEKIEIGRKLPDFNDRDSSYYNPHYVEMHRDFEVPPPENFKMKIIIDEPGMGKSTKLVNLSKGSDKSKWRIVVKLADYTKQLESLKPPEPCDYETVLSFLYKVENLRPTKFKENLLKYYLEENKVVLFFDGLNEILPKHQDKMIRLLEILSKKTHEIWVTTRKCIKERLEKKFKDHKLDKPIFCQLKPLLNDQQEEFLKTLLKKLLPDEEDARIEKLTREIIEKTHKDIDESFAGNVLHLKMLAEIYQEYLSQDNLPEEKLNLLKLYQKFVGKKYNDIYFKEKIKLEQSGIIHSDFLKRSSIIQLEKAHRRLAVSILFPEWRKRLLSSEEVITFKDEELKSYGDEELNRAGIIRSINNDINTFNFVHRTYAEYFVANLLADVLLKKSDEDPKYIVVRDFLREEIFIKCTKYNRNTRIRTFLDYKIAKDSVHFAILNNDEKDHKGRNALHLKVQHLNDQDVFKSLGRKGITSLSFESICDLREEKDELFGWTPLHYSIATGKGRWFLEVLENSYLGVNNSQDYWGQTPLHLACEVQDESSIDYLVKETTVEFISDNNGQNPLHLAAKGDTFIDDTLYFLLRKAPFWSWNERDKDGCTSLHLAIDKGRAEEFIRIAERESLDLNVSNKQGKTYLDLAREKEDDKLAGLLLENGAKVKLEVEKDKFILILQNNFVEDWLNLNHNEIVGLAESLVGKTSVQVEGEAFLNPDTKDIITQMNNVEGNSFTSIKSVLDEAKLSTAILDFHDMGKEIKWDNPEKDNIGDCRKKKDMGEWVYSALINAKDENKKTLLHYAIAGSNLNVISSLIEKGANINSPDEDGKTPLHWAVVKGNLDVVKFLIEKGTYLNVKDNFGLTPLDVAKYMNNKAIVDFLKEKVGNIQAYEKQQKAYLHLSKFTSQYFSQVAIKAVKQGLYLPSFEARNVKIDGKCVAITRRLSQALLSQGDRSFLNNLETSSEIYERIVQGKQISKREEREVFTFSKLLDGFEQQLDSLTNSLPSNLINTKSYKTFGDLSNYIARIKGDFAIHLVINNHVVAIYKVGGNYAYFDSNAAFVSGLKNVDQLMQVVEKGIKSAGYKIEEKGLLVEHFDVERANDLLSSEDKQILAKEIKTERQLLAEQDKKHGPIKINGQEVSRVQLYDFGTKVNVEGGVPLLINADMNLSSKKFQDHLDKKEVSMTAREYLDHLKDSKNIEEVIQATRFIPFEGSKREIEEAEQTRKLKGSSLEQLVKGIINSILAAVFLTSASQSEGLLKTTDETIGRPESYLSGVTVRNQQRSSGF